MVNLNLITEYKPQVITTPEPIQETQNSFPTNIPVDRSPKKEFPTHKDLTLFTMETMPFRRGDTILNLYGSE